MSTQDQYSKLEQLIKFPSVIDFRIIVDADVINSLGEIEKVINSIEHGGMRKITQPPRQSAKGNYVSYTVPVKVTCAANLKEIYEKVSALSCVKHIM
ncbi:MAG: DUF493 family protein [Succinivibrio sp.]